MTAKMTRRRVLQGGASAAVLGAAACGSGSEPAPPAPPEEVYRRLGVEPVINGIGTVTVLGGSQRAFRHGHRPSKTATRYQYQSPSYTRDRTLTVW